jgi:hypothetical protein
MASDADNRFAENLHIGQVKRNPGPGYPIYGIRESEASERFPVYEAEAATT